MRLRAEAPLPHILPVLTKPFNVRGASARLRPTLNGGRIQWYEPPTRKHSSRELLADRRVRFSIGASKE